MKTWKDLGIEPPRWRRDLSQAGASPIDQAIGDKVRLWSHVDALVVFGILPRGSQPSALGPIKK
jgi:hypothetical protein